MCSTGINFAKAPIPGVRAMSKVNPFLKWSQDKYNRDQGKAKLGLFSRAAAELERQSALREEKEKREALKAEYAAIRRSRRYISAHRKHGSQGLTPAESYAWALRIREVQEN